MLRSDRRSVTRSDFVALPVISTATPMAIDNRHKTRRRLQQYCMWMLSIEIDALPIEIDAAHIPDSDRYVIDGRIDDAHMQNNARTAA